MTEDQPLRQSLNVDKVLTEEIGYGRYQMRVLVVLMLTEIFDAASMFEYVFTAAKTPTRCVIPECDSNNTEFAPSWLLNAIPGTNSSFDNCRRYANLTAPPATPAYPSLASSYNDTCPVALFNTSATIPCEAFLYENTNSIVYDFDLACDEWRRTLLGAIRLLMTMVALPLFGFVSDKYGRRTALASSGFCVAIFGLMRYFSKSYIFFLITIALESTFGGGVFTSGYILSTEIATPAMRATTGILMHTAYCCGMMFLGVIAYFVPYWKHLTLILYTPMLLTGAYFFILPESARWYLSKGQVEKAKINFKKMAKANGGSLSEETMEMFSILKQNKKEEEALQSVTPEPTLLTQLLRHKRILMWCLVTSYCFLTANFIGVALTISSYMLGGSPYVNYIAVSSMMLPGYWIAVPLMDKFGRRSVVLAGYWICSVSQIVYIFLPKESTTLLIIMFVLAKLCVSMISAVLKSYLSELFPTKYRQNLYSNSATIGRVGAGVGPLVPALAASTFNSFPFILYSALSFVAGLTVLLLPETLGVKMPDTMEEASQIGRKKKDAV